MSRLGNVHKYAVPYLIHNRATRRWPRLVMRVSTACSVLSCGAVAVVVSIDLQSRVALLFMIPILAGMVGSIGLAIFLLFWRSVTHVVLGETLQTRPDKLTYQIAEIEQIEFVRDAKEDYDDSGAASLTQAVQIRLCSRSKCRILRLSLVVSDVKLLNEWAELNGVATRGAG